MHSPNDRAAPASYSTADVARRLGVSTPTVQRWVDQGYLKAWKTVGGHRRIDAASAEAFFAGHGLPPVEEPAPQPLSALVVDDNPDDRDVVCALIESVLPGARVATAENGFQALVAIGQSVPDLLVVDIVMPNMSGIEMLRQLSTLGVRPAVIVAVSSLGAREVAKLGALPANVPLLRKPLDPDALAGALAAAAPAR